jgi:4-alpha-glucanotransferase
MEYYILIIQKITEGGEKMHYHDELILELSALCGIVPEYWDIFGKKHETTIETRKAVLKAMGLNIDSADEIIQEIHKYKSRPWKDFVEPVQVVSVNAQPLSIPVYIPVKEDKESGLTISWYLENETKTSLKREKHTVISGSDLKIHETRWLDGERYIKTFLVDPVRRDIGYYTLHAEFKHPEKIFPGRSNKLCLRSRIIVTPDSCYIPPKLEHQKAWGLSLNLYALRSNRNWGVGDFTDLLDIVQWCSGLKGNYVGINPLHAIPNTIPYGVSPYAPISRLYKNFIYLDLEKIHEVMESVDLQKFRDRIAELHEQDLIDYEGVASIKEEILKASFDVFLKKQYGKNTKRGKAFKEYISKEGSALQLFGLYMALREHMKETHNVFAWLEWPEEYHDVNGMAAREFSNTHANSVLFYQYVQWLIDDQLMDISLNIEQLQMGIGLYHDLAIGSVSGGSDAWSYQNVIASGADVGAPPDDFSLDGQKWGFPPLIPEKLKDTGYELFIQTIQKNMKYGGAIRIDHALGLFRIFWVPDGLKPKEGAYVNQPSQDLIRIIALESVRNKTVVIAEDLGTIGENVRETLKRYRMLSYRLFYFERNYPDPSFLLPDRYPELALCAVTTHDLPTLTGYWRGRDIEVRRGLGNYSDDIWHQHINDRKRDKKLILTALRSQGVIPEDYPLDPEEITEMSSALCRSIYQYLARTPCKLLLVSLDDIIGTLDQQNLPGTVDAYPNWIRKTPLALEEIMQDQRFIDLAEGLKNRGF